VITVMYNPAMATWNAQNVTTSPSPPVLLLGFGIPLLAALPGLYRGVRRFERDGDRLMLLWLVCIVGAMYLPLNVQRRFGVGAMIPIAYFAVRAIEDVWLPRINRRMRNYVFALFLPLISISQFLMLFWPILPAITGYPQAARGIFLERDYAAAFRWLEPRTTDTDVILASPLVSAWIPGWSGARVVYGHPFETLDADEKRQQVADWYAGVGDCEALLDAYHVRYILAGPEEAPPGQTSCLTDLRQVEQVGSVAIYAP
ncbi:MAG: hypothetical protein LC121_10195, partial [Anaerolineae bacterium]|nr:hypothetical protein [Anaerolineae bacterium]